MMNHFHNTIEAIYFDGMNILEVANFLKSHFVAVHSSYEIVFYNVNRIVILTKNMYIVKESEGNFSCYTPGLFNNKYKVQI